VTQTPAAGTGTGFGFGFRGAFGTSRRPAAGTTVNSDTLSGSASYGTLTDANLTSIGALHNVAATAGGLALTDFKVSGKIPAINFSGGGGGFGSAGSGGAGGTFRSNFKTQFISVDGVDLGSSASALGPLSSGKLTSGRTFSPADANANVAVLDATYAKDNKLVVGSAVSIAKTSFKVVGLVTTPAGGASANIYIPLPRAQTLASLKGKVNTIYVAASSAANISTVSKEISGQLPKATVTNSSDLANELTGSLSSASSLASNLGRWLAIAVLAAAFLLASLLTMSAVSRRVREFGTLKALGWTSRRVVGQVIGEALVIGMAGGAVGVGLGFLGSALVGHFSPTLTAAVGQTTGSATPGGARFFGGGSGGGFPGGGGGVPGSGGGNGAGFAGRFRSLTSAAHSVPVHLSAPVTTGAILAAVMLAVAGGLIAGSFGGWRAARLRPAMALARVE
jgi:ABC-type antimicrobial peptide transport system permease subunit